MSTTTDNLDRTAIWPNIGYRSMICLLYLIGCSALSIFLSKRWPRNWHAWRSLSVGRAFVLCVLVDSFLFVVISALLVLGIGTSKNQASCLVGIMVCIFVYATSKIFIYLFLMERIHLVYGYTVKGRVSRWRSPWYRVAGLFLILWIGVAIAMIIGRTAYIREHDNACIIGLKLYATVPMLVTDVIVNVYLTTAFVVPIWRSKFPRARALAINSSFSAIAALITSFVNICILTLEHGRQLSWVCLASCGLDVMINAAIVFAVTAHNVDEEQMSVTSGRRPPPNVTSSILRAPDRTQASRKASAVHYDEEIFAKSTQQVGGNLVPVPPLSYGNRNVLSPVDHEYDVDYVDGLVVNVETTTQVEREPIDIEEDMAYTDSPHSSMKGDSKTHVV